MKLRSWIERFRDERGMSLIEIVIILVILGIAVIPLSRLSVQNLRSGGQTATMSKAIAYAQERMEQIVADYAAKDGGRGYDWVRSYWAGFSDAPATGFSRSVSISGEQTLQGVDYVSVQVSVTGPEINDVVLTTWLVED